MTRLTDIQGPKVKERISLSWKDDTRFFGRTLWCKNVFRRQSRLSLKTKEFFYTELFMLLESGIDLKNGLSIIREGQRKETDKKLFSQLYGHVVAGKSLHESLEVTGSFSPYERYSVKIGEETGRLVQVLEELGLYYSEVLEQRRKVVSAFSYPLVVVFVAVAVIFFMVEFVVPMFEGVFARFGRELPFLTRCVLRGASFLRENTAGIMMVMVVMFILFFRLRKYAFFKIYSTKLLLRIPVLGKLVTASYMHRFCQTMSLLIGAGIPLLRAIGMVGDMIIFFPLQSVLKEVEGDILHGRSLHDSLAGNPLFDQRMCSLIKLGEEISGLENAFARLAVQYKEELRHNLELMNKVLEPVLIILIGSLVAVILISMYLPMFSMGNSLYV